jgi:ASC-1-like (ASCH) protein
MIYKTEFKVHQDVVFMDKNIEQRLNFEKHSAAIRLGVLIAEKIGWEELPDEGKHLRLEVQVFSRKDWDDFRQKVRQHIIDNIQGVAAMHEVMNFKKMFDELESIGFTQKENKANQ